MNDKEQLARMAAAWSRIRLAPDQTPVGVLRDVLQSTLDGLDDYAPGDVLCGLAYDYGMLESRVTGVWGVLMDALLEQGGAATQLAYALAEAIGISMDPKLLDAAVAERTCIAHDCKRQRSGSQMLCLYHLGETHAMRRLRGSMGVLPPEEQERYAHLTRPIFVQYVHGVSQEVPDGNERLCGVCFRALIAEEPNCTRIGRPFECFPCYSEMSDDDTLAYLDDLANMPPPPPRQPGDSVDNPAIVDVGRGAPVSFPRDARYLQLRVVLDEVQPGPVTATEVALRDQEDPPLCSRVRCMARVRNRGDFCREHS